MSGEWLVIFLVFRKLECEFIIQSVIPPNKQYMLQWLKHSEIDKRKWDNCLKNATFQNVYAQSWYLDAASPQWEAIVGLSNENDYWAVMPLPSKQFLFWKKVYMPFFMQQLGIFAVPNAKIVWKDWLQILQKKYFSVQLQTHYQDLNLPHFNTFQINQRRTYHLALHQDYVNLYQSYRRDRKKDLKRANSLHIQEATDLLPLIQLFQQEKKHVIFKSEHQKSLLRLYDACSMQKKALLLYAYHEGELVAGAFFVIFQKTITYLFAVSTQKGRQCGGATALLDTVIQRYAGKPYLLDFEGGNITSLGDYFSSFGADTVIFPVLQFKTCQILRT